MKKLFYPLLVLLGVSAFLSCKKDAVDIGKLEGSWMLVKEEFVFNGKQVLERSCEEPWIFQQGNIKEGTAIPWPYVLEDNTIHFGAADYHIEQLDGKTMVLKHTVTSWTNFDSVNKKDYQDGKGSDSFEGVTIYWYNETYFYFKDDTIIPVTYAYSDNGKVWYDTWILNFVRQ